MKQNMNIKKRLYISLLCAFTLILSGCGSVPVTGRKQMLLVSDQEVLTLSLQQYSEFISAAPLSTDKKNTELVKRVGQKIAIAVETYLNNNGYESEVSNFQWEFNLVKSSDVNAFCMPGGKIVIYEGILPVTQDETGLAVVMGHEVAHAVAKHANERISQQMATQQVGGIIGGALGSTSAKTQEIASLAFGVGSQYGYMLPHSRKQELEADELGLIFMAMAGYNPASAEAFWTRMSANSSSSVAEFMSTHPSDNTRITKIREHLPKAQQYYGKGAVAPTNTKTSNKWSF